MGRLKIAIIPLSVMAFALVSAVFMGLHLNRTSRLASIKKREPVIVPPAMIEYFTFGFDELIADIFWIRSIQNFEFCGGGFSEQGFSTNLQKEIQMCKKGWIFQMLDAVTRVSPRYKIAYTRGAIMLSVVVNDLDGADFLFRRGIEVFPNDWYVNYSAAYHFAIEMNDKASAARAVEAAVKAGNGAPSWLPLLAARFYSDAGQAEFGLKALRDFYQDQPFEEWPERARERYRELEKKLASSQKSPSPAKKTQ